MPENLQVMAIRRCLQSYVLSWSLVAGALAVVGCESQKPAGTSAGSGPDVAAAKVATRTEPDKIPRYELLGDEEDIRKKGTIRFLVGGGSDYLPRSGDPRARERELALSFAEKIDLQPVFIPVESRDQLMAELNAGHGDIIVDSMTVTKERAEQVAFTRPLRFVKQVIVTGAKDESIKELADLNGKTVTVRPSTAYATTLKALAPKINVTIKPAPETADTYALIQSVARGEEKITIADSDIFNAALGFEQGAKVAADLTDKDPIAWAVRKNATQLKSKLDAFIMEKSLTDHQNDVYKADLDEIKKRKVLRVLTRNSSTSFFIYRGEQLGFEYELARELAKQLDVRLEVIVPPTREALLTYLREGRGDLVAAGLVATPERTAEFAMTSAYNKVSELLVVSAKNTEIQTLADMKGKKISVRKSSSYYQTLESLKTQHGFVIDIVPDDIETEEILDDVGAGKRFATLADSNIVEIEVAYNADVRPIGPIGEPRDQVWMMRKDQPQLLAETDAFVKKIYKGMFYNMTVNKYFKNAKNMKNAGGSDRSDDSGSLSPYDTIVQKYSKQYEFDWRLMTSQMYQESHFDPNAKSWVGALGLMQVMPRTGAELKIDNLPDPEQGVHAGIKLMAKYSKSFADDTIKEKDRIRFTLAAYNCGPGHVHDARRLAVDQKLNPNKWFGNVEKAMLLLQKPEYAKKARYGYCRCSEPVKYVSEIQTRYDAYSKLVPLDAPTK